MDRNKNAPPVLFHRVWQQKKKIWVDVGFQCQECDKVITDPEKISTHHEVCLRTKTKEDRRTSEGKVNPYRVQYKVVLNEQGGVKKVT